MGSANESAPGQDEGPELIMSTVQQPLPDQPDSHRFAPFTMSGGLDDDDMPDEGWDYTNLWHASLAFRLVQLEKAEAELDRFRNRIPQLADVLRATGFYAPPKLMSALEELQRGVPPLQVWTAEREEAIRQIRTSCGESVPAEISGIDMSELDQALIEHGIIGREIVAMMREIRTPKAQRERALPPPSSILDVLDDEMTIAPRRVAKALSAGTKTSDGVEVLAKPLISASIPKAIERLRWYKSRFDQRPVLKTLVDEAVGRGARGILRREQAIADAKASCDDPHGLRNALRPEVIRRFRRVKK